jgi:hypothetical protein
VGKELVADLLDVRGGSRGRWHVHDAALGAREEEGDKDGDLDAAKSQGRVRREIKVLFVIYFLVFEYVVVFVSIVISLLVGQKEWRKGRQSTISLLGG